MMIVENAGDFFFKCNIWTDLFLLIYFLEFIHIGKYDVFVETRTV